MKQIVYNAMVALALLVPAGCSVVEVETEDKGETLVPFGVSSAGLATKSMFVGLGSGGGAKLGTIGVAVTRTSNASYYDVDAIKQTFVAKDAAATAWDPSGTPLYLDDTEGTVFAYAPSDAVVVSPFAAGNAPKLTVVPVAAMTFTFTDGGTAGTDWDTNQLDYLYSNTQSAVSKSSPKATLTMQHAMSKISFRVMKAKGLPAPGVRDYVKKIQLDFVASGGKTGFAGTGTTLDLKTGDMTVADGSRVAQLTLTPTAPATISRQVAAYKETGSTPDFSAVVPQAFSMVPPMVVADKGTMHVTVLVGEKATTTYDRTFKTTTATGITWLKGQHYVYTILMSDKYLMIESVTLANWTENILPPLPVN